MNKSSKSRYVVDVHEHYKMYKQGKLWAFAMISTFAIGVGGLRLGQQHVHADTNDTAVVAPASGVQSSAAGTTMRVANDSAASSATSSSAASSVASQATSSTATAVSAAPTNVTNSVASSAAATSTSGAASTASQSAAGTSVATQTLVDPSNGELSAAKSSAAAAYQVTHQPQQINAVAGQSSNVTLNLSSQKLGVGSNTYGAFYADLRITSPVAGDVYTVHLPANSGVLQIQGSWMTTLDSRHLGTTVIKTNADGSYTVINTFTTSFNGMVVQRSGYSIATNIDDRIAPMTDVGNTTHEITYTVNGQEQTPVTYTQSIQPVADMQPVTSRNPANVAPTTGLLANTDYVFTLPVDQVSGVSDTTNAPSQQINAAANYGGTTITIPVPADFELNTTTTELINDMSAGTTITQPGGPGTDVIITAPRGAGSQYSEGKPAYRLAGQFKQVVDGATQLFTASGPAVMHQVVDAAGTVYTATNNVPWAVTIIGHGDSGIPESSTVAMTGNSTTVKTQLVLDNDPTNDPSYLAQITFSNDSIDPVTDAHFHITIPDGIQATSVRVPAAELSADNYLPGTTTYTYTATMVDGTTESGTVAGGQTITSQSGKAFRQLVISPNWLTAGATLATTGDMSNFDTFSIMGQLAKTYDDGRAVATGDQLDFTASLSFGDGTTQGTLAKVTETVAEPFAYMGLQVAQEYSDPGHFRAGSLSLAQPGTHPHTTDSVFEPIFYYLIPSVTNYSGINFTTPGGKVSLITAANGRTVVKIDYTGTGLYVPTSWNNVDIWLNNNADALPGSYRAQMYVYSPQTNVQTEFGHVLAGDTIYTEGHADAMNVGWDNWGIISLATFTDTTLAQGNEDQAPQLAGRSNANGDDTAHFFATMINTTDDSQSHTGDLVINLPAIGDDQGSGYDFQLTGPISVPERFITAYGNGQPIDATVLYSTQRANVVSNQMGIDKAGYMTADQLLVAGLSWANVKSIIVSVDNITSVVSTGRMTLTGKILNIKQHVNEIGYLETALSIDNGKTALRGKADGAASLTIERLSTITARLHYTDNTGEQYVALPDLTQQLRDGVDTVAAFPTSVNAMSTADQALVPTGYHLVSTSMLAADGQPGMATVGTTSSHDFDGNIFQYELQSDAHATVTFINSDTQAVIATKTISGQVGDVITLNRSMIPAADATTAPFGWVGTPGKNDYINTTVGKTYTLQANPTQPQSYTVYLSPLHQVQVQYVDDDANDAQVGGLTPLTGVATSGADWTAAVPANYALAAGQPATGTYTFKVTGNVNVVVHLVHQIKHGVTATARTIHYVVRDGGVVAPNDVTQTVTWNTSTDLVTGATIATPQDNFANVQTPYIAAADDGTVQTAWVPDVMVVAGITLQPQMGMPTNPTDVTVTYQPAKLSEGKQTWTKVQVGEPLSVGPAEVSDTNPQVRTQVGDPLFTYPQNGGGNHEQPGNPGVSGNGGSVQTPTPRRLQTDDTGMVTQTPINANPVREVPTSHPVVAFRTTNRRAFPQTSDQQNTLAVVGMLLLTGMLGLFGIKRRRRN